MRLFKLAYTENKTDVVAPMRCLFVIDIWVLKSYLFVLYISYPFYFRFIEKFNSNRMVKLLIKYERLGREEEEKKKKRLAVIKQAVDATTNSLINNKKNADNRKK